MYSPLVNLTLLLKIAIELVDLSIKNGDLPVRYVNVYQAGYVILLCISRSQVLMVRCHRCASRVDLCALVGRDDGLSHGAAGDCYWDFTMEFLWNLILMIIGIVWRLIGLKIGISWGLMGFHGAVL